MGKVPADTLPLCHCLRRGARRFRLHVVEADMSMHEIADRLDPLPSCSGRFEETPRFFRQKVCITLSASLQEYEGFEWQILNRVLLRNWGCGIWQARIAEDAIRRQVEVTRRSH